MLDWLKGFFVKECNGCTARDYHIASLKEQLRDRDAHIELLSEQISRMHEDSNDVIRHITGMNRVFNQTQDREVRSVNRSSSGMGARIAHAEAASREKAETVNVQRHNDFNRRIDELENPFKIVNKVKSEEVEEVKSDAV